MPVSAVVLACECICMDPPAAVSDVVARVGEAWSLTTSMHAGAPGQHEGLTQALLCLLPKAVPEDIHGRCLSPLLQGVQGHLSSSLAEVRVQGMLVAEVFSAIVSPDQPISFDMTTPDVTAALSRLSLHSKHSAAPDIAPTSPEEPSAHPPGSGAASTEVEEPGVEPTPALETRVHEYDPDAIPWLSSRITTERHDGDQGSQAEEDSGSESDWSESSDSSLAAYVMPDEDTESNPDTPSPPAHVAQCVAWMRETEDRGKLEAGLRGLAAAVTRGGPAVHEHCEGIATCLVNWADPYGLEDGPVLRRQAFAALVAVCGARAVRSLANYFYARGLGLGDRACVVQGLVDGAILLSSYKEGRSLHNPEASALEWVQEHDWSMDDPKALPPAGTPEWQFSEQVQKRIDERTRRWGSGAEGRRALAKAAEATENRMAGMLGEFVFPLLWRVNHDDMRAVLYGDDPLVMCRLVHALGKFVELAGLSCRDDRAVHAVLVFAHTAGSRSQEPKLVRSALYCFLAASRCHDVVGLEMQGGGAGADGGWLQWFRQCAASPDRDTAAMAMALCGATMA